MADQLSISLQAPSSVDKEKESIGYLISRINDRKGAFRLVTEQSLEQEIQDFKDGKASQDEVDLVDTLEEAEYVKAETEEISKKRDEIKQEILKQTTQARQEIAQGLDFLSLSLSKQTPGPAGLTMSPYLKQTIPTGSLGVEVVQRPQVSDFEKQTQEMVAIGWRMQSLNGAADSLLKSASRLGEEIGREVTYWDQILAVKDLGWSLCRLPREKHTLGVRYGFAEACSGFRDRGLAALRRDEDGNINLDRGLQSSTAWKLGVRILENGKPTASSIIGLENESPDDSIGRLILRARNSIFDEELQNELHREALNLANQGVRCNDGCVLLPYEGDKQIEIKLLPLENISLEDPTSSDRVSSAIAIFLRILLSNAHRQKLQSRTNPPKPLRENKAPRPISPILKPIIEIMQHRSQVHTLSESLEVLQRTMATASMHFSIDKPKPPLVFASLLSQASKPGPSNIDTILGALRAPLTTSIKVHLLKGLTTITIEVYTTLVPPTFGTAYQTTTETTSKGSVATMPQAMRLTALFDLQNHLMHIILLEIMHDLVSNFGGWRPPSAHSTQILRSQLEPSRKDVVSISLTESALTLSWQRNSGLAGQGTWVWHGELEGQEDREMKRPLHQVFAEEIDSR